MADYKNFIGKITFGLAIFITVFVGGLFAGQGEAYAASYIDANGQYCYTDGRTIYWKSNDGTTNYSTSELTTSAGIIKSILITDTRIYVAALETDDIDDDSYYFSRLYTANKSQGASFTCLKTLNIGMCSQVGKPGPNLWVDRNGVAYWHVGQVNWYKVVNTTLTSMPTMDEFPARYMSTTTYAPTSDGRIITRNARIYNAAIENTLPWMVSTQGSIFNYYLGPLGETYCHSRYEVGYDYYYKFDKLVNNNWVSAGTYDTGKLNFLFSWPSYGLDKNGVLNDNDNLTTKALTAEVISDGATGYVKFKLKFGSQYLGYSYLQYSTDGTNYTDWGYYNGNTISINTNGVTYDNIWFRAKFLAGVNNSVSSSFNNYKYTKAVKIPIIKNTPALTYTTSPVTWSKTRGFSNITITWPSVTNATGYRLWVFDGYAYRSYNMGNVNSFNSSALKIYPFASDLPLNNSVTTDIFRWAGDGRELEDRGYNLYKSTSGTTFDTRNNYWFRITAYNAYMETKQDSSYVYPTLAYATDAEAPELTAALITAEGLDKTYVRDVSIQVNSTDTASGLRYIQLSNDGTTFNNVFVADLNSAGGTDTNSVINTYNWTLSAGAGTKTVYIKAIDALGNEICLTVNTALAEDSIPPSVLEFSINDNAESTTIAEVHLTISLFDNASSESAIKMRFSNDAVLWSAWEPFQFHKAWNILNETYGGTSNVGIKTVYMQISDAAQNLTLARDNIGYNPNPPTGSITIANGVSGLWNGEQAIFTCLNSPTLSFNYATAEKIRIDRGLGIWGEWEDYSSNKVVYLNTIEGSCLIKVQVKDIYGVIGDADEYLIVIDNNKPIIKSLTGYKGATATNTSSVTLSIEAEDNTMGSLYYCYSVNGGSYTAPVSLTGSTITVSGLTTGSNTITVEVRDAVGNYTRKDIIIFRI